MAAEWDLFVDETKNGGDLTALGVLALHAGVTGRIFFELAAAKNKVAGEGARVGELHWSDLGNLEARVAKEWLEFFFRRPMMFFVSASCKSRETKEGAVRRVVETLERDKGVPYGLVRSSTTLHLDVDSADPCDILQNLRSGFGLLRAFAWESRGSLLLQLSDVLLGIARADVSGTLDDLADDASQGQLRRADVLSQARSIVRDCFSHNKRNAVVSMDVDGTVRWLLCEHAQPTQ